MVLHFKKNKRLRYVLAYVLSLVLFLSNFSSMQVQAYTVGGDNAEMLSEESFAAPVVTAESNRKLKTITLSWEAITGAAYYQVFRYSDDQSEAEAECISDHLTENKYVDAIDIDNVDMPFYYYVKAVSEANGNESSCSETVWSMVPSSRTAHRVVYGAQTEDIFLTKKSYDTVFTNQATVEGIVYETGTLRIIVNDTVVEEKKITAGGSFFYELTLEEGRNIVEIQLEKENETTRCRLNFVYLTNYDIVVDAGYEGADGGASENGVPTYKTVQAAVNSIPSDNIERKVILVRAGSYEERLEVNSPYVSLIGENRENTLIHSYPGVLGEDYEAGGDIDKRCATFIKSSANNFSAENISFANDYEYGKNDGKNDKSADAIHVEADNSTFVNVHFIGVQNTLYMHSGFQYYENCLIEGLVDYIYSGEEAKGVFKDCELRFVYEPTMTSGYIAAPKTATDAEYGLVFVNCAVTAEEGCAGNGYRLARPWGADAFIAWLNTYMGKVVNELAPYGDMNGNMHKDARFYEFGTYGPGFAVNADRRQISFAKSENFIRKSWDGINNMDELSSAHYVGDIVSDAEEKFEEEEPDDDKYLWSEGDDTGLGKYRQEGYASSYEVTGGGLLKETNDNYYEVSTGEEFLDALVAIKASGKPSVIELIADIKLGCNEIENFADYDGIIKAHNAQPLTHPGLIDSGVSQVTFDKINNLTIFSRYGSTIMHANITMKNSENIIIRNIKFDELWEWDEATGGDYDRNDWDFITVDSACDGIWIDHCTFYKAYDSVVDVKDSASNANITISWCEFLPGSEYNVFFRAMMNEIFDNPSAYPTYQHMLEAGMTNDQIYSYAYGQKKTHLFGQSDDAESAAGIRVTLANNYYRNTMDGLPRVCYGDTHVYNCIMDAQELSDVRLSISNEDIANKIVSNGASSNCGAEVLLENCYISGIRNAMNSGDGSSPSGYINAINSLYYMDGIETELAPKVNTSKEGEPLLITNAADFVVALPYDENYKLYQADELHGIVIPNAGARKCDLTVLQWEKTSYNVTEEEEVEEPEVEEAPMNKPEAGERNSLPESVVNALREVTGCDTAEELVDYLRTEITTNEAVTEKLSGINVADTVVVDIRVMLSYDGFNWDLATPANFPKEGVDVLIPYEAISSNTVKLNKDGFDYAVGHMSTESDSSGQMEFFLGEELRKTDVGIQLHIMSASPFVIGWKAINSTAPNPGAGENPGTEPEEPTKPVETKKPLSVGTSASDDGGIATYKVTVSDVNSGTVTYVAPKNKKAATVTIPTNVTIKGITYKVTAIQKNAFKNNKYLKKITIGDNIITIGDNAFYGCKKLKTVKFGRNVEVIGNKAFYKCTSLSSVTIPSKVKKIGKSAFEGCKKLKKITFKTKLLKSSTVGKNAFKGIYAKTTVKVPKKKFKAYKSMLLKKGIGKKAKFKKG